jgi:protein-tyrosine kinase
MDTVSTPPISRGTIRLGQQLLGAGKLTEDEIARVVSVQRQRNVLFGEAAIRLGFVTQEDVLAALARQFDYPCASPDDSNFSPLLVAATQPYCAQSEAFRALRSQLVMRWFTDHQKILAVTAGRRRQGASTLAANLAILFAQMGERTLLIDANLRNPGQSRLFGLGNSGGLSDVLTGRCEAQEAVSGVAAFENLYVLVAGVPPPNPQELLSRVGFSYLIETAPAGFDVVIVDTPPILEFADAQLVACLTKGCLLAVKRNEARVADISKVRAQLQPTTAELVGAVMFD